MHRPARLLLSFVVAALTLAVPPLADRASHKEGDLFGSRRGGVNAAV
jgi:hypothetical protein